MLETCPRFARTGKGLRLSKCRPQEAYAEPGHAAEAWSYPLPARLIKQNAERARLSPARGHIAGLEASESGEPQIHALADAKARAHIAMKILEI